MKLHPLLATGMLVLLLAASGAFGADRAQRQAEVRKAAQASLERFYKANPRLKSEVDRAPGYAVFTTFGVSLILGGAGGTGMAHDRQTGTRTYMNMAQASVGVQIGAAESDTLIIFKTPAALARFVDKGWEFGGGVTAEAAADGKTVGIPEGKGENLIADAFYYTLTKNGLQAGGAVAGTKFWKDRDLN
jgi:lipid-binding SYLF domain-containing protein